MATNKNTPSSRTSNFVILTKNTLPSPLFKNVDFVFLLYCILNGNFQKIESHAKTNDRIK